jgi:two-component system, sensor histidine kinase PdtaS
MIPRREHEWVDRISMLKNLSGAFTAVLTCLLPFQGLSQPAATAPANFSISYHPASQCKLSWQRLLLQLSAAYYNVVKENQVDLDSGLVYASKSLGLSRLPILAEGLDDQELPARSQWVDSRDPGEGIRLLSGIKGKRHLELLVLLGAYYAFQPDSYHRYGDSARYFLNSAIGESNAIGESALGRQARCLLGKIYVQGADSVQGGVLFDQLLNECKMTGDRVTEARSLFYRGLYTRYSRGNSQTRITYLQEAINDYRSLHDTAGEISSLTDMGYLQIVTYQITKAYATFLQALRLEDSIKFPYTEYNSDAVAMATAFENKFGEPLRYSLETIRAAEINRDSIGWAYFYNRLGFFYHLEGGRDKESLKWMRKALDRFILSRDPALYLNLWDLIAVMNGEGDGGLSLPLVQDVSKRVPPKNFQDLFYYNLALSKAYSGIKQYDQAEKYMLQADVLEKKLESFIGPLNKGFVTKGEGLLYFKEHQYAKAKLFFGRYLADPSKMKGALVNEIDVYQDLIGIDSVFHDPVSGVNDYRIYTQLLDSNFRVSKLRQAEELQVKYLTEEKENQITVLNQQAELQQADVRHANLVRDLTIGALIVLLIIAGLLYKQNTLKQRSNEVISQKNGQLQHLVTEREWLLKEIHHRVKNNFQTVMDLLGIQSIYLKNDVAIAAISDSQRRINAMSLIHQRLYQTENLSAIYMPDYINELIHYLRDSFNINNRIRFDLQIEPIKLELAQCIPLSLILNEAITNAFKYAFPNDRKGVISISLRVIPTHHLLLSIEDNGIGLPAEFSGRKHDSMGVNLIRGLSADLEAELTINGEQGTKVAVRFPYSNEASLSSIR